MSLRRKPRASSARIAAIETAISAGWALAVSVSVSSGPSQISCRQLFAERVVDLVEDCARFGKRVGQVLAHADGLAALPRKGECDRHDGCSRSRFAVTACWRKAASQVKGGGNCSQASRPAPKARSRKITARRFSIPPHGLAFCDRNHDRRHDSFYYAFEDVELANHNAIISTAAERARMSDGRRARLRHGVAARARCGSLAITVLISAVLVFSIELGRARLAAPDARFLPAAIPAGLDHDRPVHAAADRLRRAVRPPPQRRAVRRALRAAAGVDRPPEGRTISAIRSIRPISCIRAQIIELMPLLVRERPWLAVAWRPAASPRLSLLVALWRYWRRRSRPIRAEGAASRGWPSSCRRWPSSFRSWISPPSPGRATACRSSRSCGTRRRTTPPTALPWPLRSTCRWPR